MSWTFWLMDRKNRSWLQWTKLSWRSRTGDGGSMVNIRQLSDVLRSCLWSGKLTLHKRAYQLREVTDWPICSWCVELLKAPKTIAFETFVRCQKPLKRVNVFATDREPQKGLSDWYTMRKNGVKYVLRLIFARTRKRICRSFCDIA